MTATTTRTLTFREAINEAMRIAMCEDPTVVLLGEDVTGGAMGTPEDLVQEFGRARVLDTPISEAAFIGAAIGAATTGLRPITELMIVDFFGVCMDQIA